MDTIKCGRIVYELEDGDTIMDNGACYQLITRHVIKNYSKISPRVSKKAFNDFIKNPKVKINPEHNWGKSVTLYTYVDKKEE